MSDETTKVCFLSLRATLLWGAVGGLFYVASHYGFMDYERVHQVVVSSEEAITSTKQLTPPITMGVIVLISVLVGAAWARVHAPIRSISLAFQLGFIAPIVLGAAVTTAAQETKAGDETLSGAFPDLAISSAYAGDASDSLIVYQNSGDEQESDGDSVLDCVISTLALEPC